MGKVPLDRGERDVSPRVPQLGHAERGASERQHQQSVRSTGLYVNCVVGSITQTIALKDARARLVRPDGLLEGPVLEDGDGVRQRRGAVAHEKAVDLAPVRHFRRARHRL